MDKTFLVTHVLPISAGAIAQMFVLYRDRGAVGTGMLVGFGVTLLTSELISPRVMQLGLREGWLS